jgi:hypothetical protein
MIIDEPTAEAKKLAVGDTVDFTMVGGTKKLSVGGIYKPAEFLGPYVVAMPTYDALGGLQRDNYVYVNLQEGTDVAVADRPGDGAEGLPDGQPAGPDGVQGGPAGAG